jgi:clan AA aspartic protease
MRRVGITYVDGTVRNDGGEEQVRFLVDSGAGYTLLPERVWKSLRLEPKRQMDFILADGTTIQRGISECLLELPQGSGHTPVILGEPRDEALLGVVTLEVLGLVFNPFERRLQPMRARLS